MAPSKASTGDFDALRAAIANTTTLLNTFQLTLQSAHQSTLLPASSHSSSQTPQSSHSRSPPSSTEAPPSAVGLAPAAAPPTSSIVPLALLADSSRLLSAQITKLSLLILNDPFSPKEISHILNRPLCEECLPALASAVELLRPEVYSNCLTRYVKGRVDRVWEQLAELVREIPRDERSLRELRRRGKHDAGAVVGQGVGTHAASGKGTLASTGVLWNECAKLAALSSGGDASNEGTGKDGVKAVWRETVRSNMALLEDAIGEIEEWDPDENDDYDDSEADDEEGDAPSGKEGKKAITKTPTTSEDEAGGLDAKMEQLKINPMLTLKKRVIQHLKLARMLCEALSKRRISTFPPLSNQAKGEDESRTSRTQIKQLDQTIDNTKSFYDEADELAGELYAEDADSVEKRLKAFRTKAMNCVELNRLNWQGEEDIFTTWSDKWRDRLNEIGKQ